MPTKCAYIPPTLLIVFIILWAPQRANWDLIHVDKVSDGVPISALFLTNSDQGWAITPGELLKMSDGGGKWVTVLSNPSAERAFYSMTFNSPATGFIVGTQQNGSRNEPLILRTIDGGKAWQDSPIANLRAASSQGLHSLAFCDPRMGWAVGPALIVHTVDGGNRWDVQRSGTPEEFLFSIACASSERAWAVGRDGLILQSTNAGTTWNRQESPTNVNLLRIRFFDNVGWIVGGKDGRGVLIHSRDGGESWQSADVEVEHPLFDIYMNGINGWIVGGGGTLLQTTDGGRTWIPRPSPTKADLTALFFLNRQQGWAGGDKRTLLRYEQ